MSMRFQFDTFTPFSKSSNSPTFYRDGSESEVEDIYESMSYSGDTSRCSSADTSKESLFSPFSRSRSLSSGGSKKSPRNSHSCSPANHFRSCSTDDEGRDSVGSVSKKFNSFSMHDLPSSPRSLSVSETIMEDDDEVVPPLPTFFSPEQQLGKCLRGRADSFSDDTDYNPSPGLIQKPSYELAGSPQVFYNDENTKASNEEPMKRGHFKMPFQPHNRSVFSPHPSTSGADNCEPPPIPTPFEPTSSTGGGGRFTAVVQRSVSLSGLRHDSGGIAETLNFGDSFTNFTTRRLSDHDSTSLASSSSSSMMSFRDHTFSDFSRNRHHSVNPNLSRGSTIGGPTQSSKKRYNLTDGVPQSPPPMQRTLSQSDEYLRHNNPRFAAVICTPQGAQTRSLKTSGEDGHDWAATEGRDEEELKSFSVALRVSVNGPRVTASSSKERDMFVSN
eukprot:CAMPEP_0114451694 /NCGR_PEP_ID=MMETSP0104-20121206/1118_1 /TAXON_ID=37642 ORGANISM="Paraphysomonas imperforata, Strain PA2" /NCGR_SAMPLE_ID=MMETSP0104 /ASSEMBLY_ACC=CAM_ASM_000202 /LENGTH=443 /DNA_ID=CAMNT_0001623895 /DNA_START=95 /DNA_END=1426 /DNA_ORIENTATION=+